MDAELRAYLDEWFERLLKRLDGIQEPIAEGFRTLERRLDVTPIEGPGRADLRRFVRRELSSIVARLDQVEARIEA